MLTVIVLLFLLLHFRTFFLCLSFGPFSGIPDSYVYPSLLLKTVSSQKLFSSLFSTLVAPLCSYTIRFEQFSELFTPSSSTSPIFNQVPHLICVISRINPFNLLLSWPSLDIFFLCTVEPFLPL